MKLWALPAYRNNTLLLFAASNGSGSGPMTNSSGFADIILFCKFPLGKNCSIIPVQTESNSNDVYVVIPEFN